MITKLFTVAVALLVIGCNTYHLTVVKVVNADNGSDVQMNSDTQADGNTSNPSTTTTPTLDVDASAIPR